MKMVAGKSFIILFLAAAYIHGGIAGKCYLNVIYILENRNQF